MTGIIGIADPDSYTDGICLAWLLNLLLDPKVTQVQHARAQAEIDELQETVQKLHATIEQAL